MKRPISLRIFSVAAVLLMLMVVVTWLSVLNFRQQMVHMERRLAEYSKSAPDQKFIAGESGLFDDRGVNAGQIVDSSLRLLAKGEAATDIELDRVTLAVPGRQLPNIQLNRQRFHATFRRFAIEAKEGNSRSVRLVREELLRAKQAVDEETRKTLDLLNALTRGAAARAEGAKRANMIGTSEQRDHRWTTSSSG